MCVCFFLGGGKGWFLKKSVFWHEGPCGAVFWSMFYVLCGLFLVALRKNMCGFINFRKRFFRRGLIEGQCSVFFRSMIWGVHVSCRFGGIVGLFMMALVVIR